MNRLLAVWVLVAAVGAACSVPYGSSSPRETAATDESARGFLAADSVALDDVTNGLANNPRRTDREGAALGRALQASAAEVAGQPAGADRMLVYRGRIDVEVPRTEDAATMFLTQVVSWGGYVQQQEQRSERDVLTLTVRVPSVHFDAAFALLRASGRVLGESRQAEDVTEEFVDLGIRLDNAIKSRDRLLEVLAKATKVEDVLAVEKELRRLTEEIERMEGRRKFLADRVAMATIEASFRSNQTAPPPTKTRRPSRFPWVNQLGPRAVMEGY